MTLAERLHEDIRRVCPAIVSVSIGQRDDKATWLLSYGDGATDAQKAAAAAVVAAFSEAKPTVDEIVAERKRRLALGYNYNFGDARGLHRIGTSAADMIGWSEVSTYAGALLDRGDTTTTIPIVTDTGPCLVTAPEWRAIEIAAAQFRQPIWAKSFVLQASLPADYANDSHWA